MKQKLLTAIASVAVVLSAGFMPEDAAAFEPSRPIELVVHSAPGGGSDVFAKELAKIIETEKVLGQPLRIVNKTARAGLEAMAYLVEKKGADHTIAIFTNTWIATPLTAKDARYTVRDLTPLVRLVLEPTIAVVRADQPHKTMREFVEAARKAPGALKQAGGSVTAIESLTGLLVQKAAGVQWTFIPTPSIKDRIGNLLAGTVDLIVPQPQDVNEHIASGRMRPIATFTEKRLAILPQVSTIREQGINVPLIANSRGVLAPPGIPKAVIDYWEGAFARLVKTASWRKYLAENQVEDVFLGSRDLGASLGEQTTLMRAVLKEAGVAVAN